MFLRFIVVCILGITLGYLFFTNSIFVIGILIIFGYFAVKSLSTALYLFIFSLPFNNVATVLLKGGSFIFPLRVSYIFFFFLVIAVLYSYKKEEIEEKIRTPLDPFFFIFLFIVIISIFQSRYIPENPYIILNAFRNYPWIKSITKILPLLLCLGVYYVCMLLLDSKEKIKESLYAYIITAIVISGIGLFFFFIYLLTTFIASINGYPFVIKISNELPRLVGIESEPMFFGFYLMTILPVLYAFIFLHYFSTEKITFFSSVWLLSITTLLTVTLFLTGSRSAILGFMVSGVVLFFAFKGKRTYSAYYKEIRGQIEPLIKKGYFTIKTSKKIKTFLIFCLLFLSIYNVVYDNAVIMKISWGIEKGIIIPVVGTFDSDYGKFWSTKTRLIMYQYALDAWKQHPWLGIGHENYNFYSGQRFYYGLYDFNLNWPEVNNYPLRVLAEYGIIGFLFLILFVFSLFYYIWDAIKTTDDIFIKTILKGYFAVFSGIVVILQFSSNITRFYLWVALGIAFAIVKIVKYERSSHENSNKHPFIV